MMRLKTVKYRFLTSGLERFDQTRSRSGVMGEPQVTPVNEVDEHGGSPPTRHCSHPSVQLNASSNPQP